MSWKKGIRRTLLALLALILIVFVGGWIFVHTGYFKHLVIGKIEQQAGKSTGEQLSIGNMVIHWTQLKVDLYNVVLRKPSMSPPPFFSCSLLAVTIKILSLWHAKFAISELVLNRPAVHMRITAQGLNNLPHAATAASVSASTPAGHASSSTAEKIFSLGIRHLVIAAGEIDYNDAKYPLTADLRDLHATARFDVPAQAYRGSLAYHRAFVSAPHVLGFEHDLQMHFVATSSALDVTSLRIETGRTRLQIHGTVADYAHPRVQAKYTAAIFTPDLSRVLNSPSIPAGEVWTNGSLSYDSGTHRPFLDTIHAEGNLQAPHILAHVAGVYVQARQIQAGYILQHGNVSVPKIAGYAMGGSLDGSFSIAEISTRREGRLSATLRGASLSELMQFAASKRRRPLGLTGTTDAEVQAAWAGTFSNALAHVRASIFGPLRTPSPRSIPVNGFVDVRYDGVRDTATFAPSNLRTQNTQISFHGTISKNSSLTIDASAHQLADLSPLASSLMSNTPSSRSSSLDSLGLRGQASFNGSVRGSLANPAIRGHLAGTHVFVKGTYLSTVQGNLSANPSGVSIQDARVTGTMNGKLTLNAHLGLRHWSFTKTSPMSLQVKATGLSVTDLMRMAKVHYQLTGKLDADISAHGSEQNPQGYANISVSEMSPRSPNPVKKLLSLRKFLTIHLQGNGNLVHAQARLTIHAGQISTILAYAPKTEHYNGQISAPSLDLSKLKFAQQRGIALAGIANFSANGSGTLKRPEIDAHLAIPKLQIQGQTISAVRSRFQIANRQASFALSSIVAGGYAQAKGSVALRGNYPATASLDLRALPIGPLLASYSSRIPAQLGGQIELHATLSGPLKQPQQIKAQVQIPTLNLAYRDVHLALAAPMHLLYANGLLDMSRTEMKGTDTNLILEGTIPIKSAQPLNVSANGSLNLALLQSFGAGIRSSGRVILHIAAQGGVSHPAMHGQIQIASATFLSETYPIAIESLNGKIQVSGTRLQIAQLQGTVGGGNLSASGFFQYGAQPTFNLSAQAKSIRIRYPQGIRTLMDANLNLAGSPAKSSLTGRVLVDRLSLTQQFDIASLIGQFGSQTPSTGPSAFEQNMKLHVAVASSSALNLTSSKLSIGGNFNLTIAGTAADPVVLGRVALSQGEVFFMGKRYEIQSGTIAFANPIRTEPVLNVYARTTVDQYKITLNFVGPIDRLRTNYTSSPPLSEADIIHLIAFGTTAEQAATSPSTPASVAAESILAQGVSSQVAGKLEKLTGISQITLDPLVTSSSGSNPGSQIAIQERFSGSLLLTFSTSVTRSQADAVEVQYTTPQRVRISVLRDYNGGYALDVRFRKTF